MLRTFALICTLVFLLAGLATAQYSPPLKSEIPFASTRATKNYPLGSFVSSRVSPIRLPYS